MAKPTPKTPKVEIRGDLASNFRSISFIETNRKKQLEIIARTNNDENSREFKIKAAEEKARPIPFPDANLETLINTVNNRKQRLSTYSV